jgi:serine/threonine-protein kinase
MVTDFGLARSVDEAVAWDDATEAKDTQGDEPAWPVSLSSLTRTSLRVGTPGYVAPEQLAGGDADQRSDQFAFCVALYEALYGTFPFSAKNLQELRQTILRGDLAHPPSTARVPAWLRDAVCRGLRARPEERYPSMRELLAKLNDDAKKRHNRRALHLTLGLTLLGLLVGIYRYSGKSSPLCNAAAQIAEQAWGSSHQEEIKRAFLATHRIHAADTFDRVKRHLDRWTSHWIEHHTDACEATHVRKEQPEDILDLRMTCLSRKLESLKSLVRLFAVNPTGEVVDKAVEASAALGRIDFCADVEALRQAVPPPEDREVRIRVGWLRSRLEEVRLQDRVGHYQEAASLLAEIEDEVVRLGYVPLQNEFRVLAGQNRNRIGKYDEAIEILHTAYVSALAWNQREIVAGAAQGLAYAYGERKNHFEMGLVFADIALGLSLGLGDEFEAKATTQLANIAYKQGHLEKAAGLHRRALRLFEQALGPAHPSVATSIFDFAAVLREQAKYAEAETWHRRALAARMEYLGPQHPDVAASLHELANIDFLIANFGDDEKKFEEAERSIRLAIAIRQQTYGNEHPDVAESLELLAIGRTWQGHHAEAESMHREILDLRRKALGPWHVDTLGSMANLAMAISRQGRLEEAEMLIRQALMRVEEALGPASLDKGHWLYNLAGILVKQGRQEEAVAIYRQSILIKEQTENAAIAASYYRLGKLLLSLERYAEAKGYLERAQDLCDATGGCYGDLESNTEFAIEQILCHE